MEVSQELLDDIIREYRRTRSPFRTAKACGVEPSLVISVIGEHSDKLTKHPERYEGYGRPEVAPYLVGRRKVSSREWDNDDPAISAARAAYEAGTHDMATGRDGGWLLLYSFPLKKPVPRPNYFKPEYF